MSLHPTAQIFKKQLENYVEGRSKGYIKDIGERRWDSRFYSEFMPLVFCIIFYILIYRYSKKNFIFHRYFYYAYLLNPHSNDIRCTEEAVEKCCAIFLVRIIFYIIFNLQC